MTVHTPATDARINQIRQWIDTADRGGVARSDMRLHLSHRDLAGLKRSAGVRVDEIRFVDGVMSFLGVEIASEAAASSSLEQRASA